MKRKYTTLSMNDLHVGMTGSILASSIIVTNVPIKISNDVVVEEFKNGFGDDPASGNDFKEVTFE